MILWAMAGSLVVLLALASAAMLAVRTTLREMDRHTDDD